MKVLSIDWDFFQNVSVDTVRECYPDGIDLPTTISEITWGSHYATNSEQLETISVSMNEFERLLTVLLRQDKKCPVMIANSHVHAYHFIKEHLSFNDKVKLTNVDMHHDLMNDNEEVDCGNWIGRLIAEGYVDKGRESFTWIHNDISLPMYNIDLTDGTEFSRLVRQLDGGSTIENIKDEKYDLIFLARSDTWSPPHLDSHFCLLANFMKSHFANVKIENGVDKPRRAYLQYAVVLQKQTEKIRNGEVV